MFTSGDKGYTINNGATALTFYQQRMQVRPGKTLGRFGHLFHEYAIDQYCKVEKNRLNFIRSHQRELRASTREDDRPEEVVVGLAGMKVRLLYICLLALWVVQGFSGRNIQRP